MEFLTLNFGKCCSKKKVIYMCSLSANSDGERQGKGRCQNFLFECLLLITKSFCIEKIFRFKGKNLPPKSYCFKEIRCLIIEFTEELTAVAKIFL